MRRMPLYALVQTALLQDEALRRANARIEELQAQAGGVEQRGTAASKQLPRQLARGLQPARAARLGADGAGAGLAAASRTAAAGPYPPQMPGYGAGPAFGAGGSFLGSTARRPPRA